MPSKDNWSNIILLLLSFDIFVFFRVADHGKKFQESGDEIADPVEVSTMRRDDLLGHRGTFEGDDALQCTNEPSTRTPRGHQVNTVKF